MKTQRGSICRIGDKKKKRDKRRNEERRERRDKGSAVPMSVIVIKMKKCLSLLITECCYVHSTCVPVYRCTHVYQYVIRPKGTKNTLECSIVA